MHHLRAARPEVSKQGSQHLRRRHLLSTACSLASAASAACLSWALQRSPCRWLKGTAKSVLKARELPSRPGQTKETIAACSVVRGRMPWQAATSSTLAVRWLRWQLWERLVASTNDEWGGTPRLRVACTCSGAQASTSQPA